MRLKTQTLYGEPFFMEVNGLVLRNDSLLEKTIQGKQKGITGFGCEETIEIGPRQKIIEIIAEKVDSENPLVQAVRDMVKAHKSKKSKKKQDNQTPSQEENPTKPPMPDAPLSKESVARCRLIESALENDDIDTWRKVLENTTWSLQAIPPLEESNVIHETTNRKHEGVFSIKEVTAA